MKALMTGLAWAAISVLGWRLAWATAATADRQTASQSTTLKSYPVAASATIYKGTMVCLSAGYLVPAADTAGLSQVVGVADEKVDNSSGSAGTKNCRVRSGESFKLVASVITQADLGRVMYAVDDQTFDTDDQDNAIVAGVLIEFISSTSGRLYIPTTAPGGVSAPSEVSMQVRNESGSPMEAGDLVYVSNYDETEDRFIISLADADAQGAAAKELWVLREALANNTNGTAYKTYRETAQNTDTTTEGDPIFLGVTAGDWTYTTPTDADPNGVSRVVGHVAVVSASVGEVEINLAGGGVEQFGTNEIQNDAVTGPKIPDDALDSDHYTDGSIDREHHADAAVGADALDLSDFVTIKHIAHSDGSPVEILAADAGKARTVAIFLAVTEDMSGTPEFDIGETDTVNKFMDDIGSGAILTGETLLAVGTLTATKALICTIVTAGTAGEFDLIVIIGA